MNPYKNLTAFLQKYGSTLVRLDGETAKGICTRVDSNTATAENLSFDRLGYTVKREYLLITDADTDILTENAHIFVNDRHLQIICVDDTCHADEVLCRRGWGYEVKEVVT